MDQLQGKIIEKSLILRIWGKTKPYHPLLFHLIDTGNVAYALLDAKSFYFQLKLLSKVSGCPENILKHWIGYIVALHDIGKCTALFQAKADPIYIEPLLKAKIPFSTLQDPKYRHEAFSGIWIQKHLIEEFGWGKRAVRTIASCLRGHHGDFFSKYTKETEYLENTWSKLRNTIVSFLQEVFLKSTPPSKDLSWNPDNFSHHSVIGALLSSIIILADWICSNESLFIIPLQRDIFIKEQDFNENYESIVSESAFRTMASYLHSINNYHSISLRQAKKAVERLGFDCIHDWTSDISFKDLWNFENLRPIQICSEYILNKIQENPEIFIIEAPMGEGKTEVALYIASVLITRKRLAGMYIALPTAATSNQMHKRVNEFMKNHKVNSISNARLIHSMSWLQDDEYTPNYSQTIIGEPDDNLSAIAFQWFKPKRRALLSPYAVGTVDQAMMSVLRVKFGVLRLLGLSGKILIIDEVHAYDAYMSRIIIKLLKWAKELQIPVILLSATLPQSKKQRIFEELGMDITNFENNEENSYPLITIGKHNGKIETYPVMGGSTIENVVRLELHYGCLGNAKVIATLAINGVKEGGCLCVIANTVRSAQEIFNNVADLCKNHPSIEYGLFHARFKAVDRAQIETKVLNDFGKGSLKQEGDLDFMRRPIKAILVATQVIEQSLDLDFDEMITEIAPIDSILQRAGRMWRHQKRKKRPKKEPILHVLLPDLEKFSFGSIEKIYSSYLLLKTCNALHDRHQIIIPDEIRSLVEEVYNDINIEKSSRLVPYELLSKNKEKMEQKIAEEYAAAAKYLISEPEPNKFLLSRQTGFSFDEEEKRNNYFHVQTRLGDITKKIILLDDDDSLNLIMENKERPNKKDLRKVMEKSLSIPKYLIIGATPLKGYSPIREGPDWLLNYKILILKNNEWKGKNNEKLITITYNPEIGLQGFIEE